MAGQLRGALRALLGQVARTRRGLHTTGCATIPREIVRRPMDYGPDGNDEPVYAPPGKCDCGAVEVAKLVDDALACEEK